MEQTMNRKNLTNNFDLHPSYQNWSELLAGADLEEEWNGWSYYLWANYHYIVEPKGDIKLLFGFDGRSYWRIVKEKEQVEHPWFHLPEDMKELLRKLEIDSPLLNNPY